MAFLEHFCWSENVHVFGKTRGHFKKRGHFKCIPHGVLFTAPIAAILHKNSTERSFTDIFTVLRAILKDVSGQDLTAEYLISDSEVALYKGFLKAFDMNLRIPCTVVFHFKAAHFKAGFQGNRRNLFHKSQSLKEKFIELGYKKMLDSEDPNPIKNLFKGLLKDSLFPLKKAQALAEIFEGRVMITKFDNDPEIDDEHKTKTLKIIFYLKKQLFSRGDQPSWLTVIQTCSINSTNNDIEQGRKAAVVIRWGIEFFILCGSAPLEPHFIRHRDSVALFNSRFFGTARLEPHFIRYRDSAPLFNSRYFGAAPLEPHFIRHRDSVALFNSRFFSSAPLEPHLIHY
jgi:hypothetical protein